MLYCAGFYLTLNPNPNNGIYDDGVTTTAAAASGIKLLIEENSIIRGF
jgi:hypothetical protein